MARVRQWSKTMTTALSKELAGKVAVITGGIGGIGFAMAPRFVAERAYIFSPGNRQTEW